MNDNICSHYFIVDDVNGFHRVFFVTRDGTVRKAQWPYVSRSDAEANGRYWTGKPLPRSAQPA